MDLISLDLSSHSLSVIVPTFNEAATLRVAVERLLKTDLPLPVEVIVVDDGSTDDSLDSIADLVEDGDVVLIRHERNRGKGAAVRSGIDAAGGTYLTVLDADLEYDPSDFPELLRPLVEGRADVVYGTRTFGSHTAYSFWYVIGNRCLSFWASFLFDSWLSDIETCLKVAPLQLWRSLALTRNGFGIEAEATAKFLAGGNRIHEVPVSYAARRREEGKKLRARDGIGALWILLKGRLMARPVQTATPVTRGYGVLEAFLARRRAKKTRQLLSGEASRRSILDIGCGFTPSFLSRIDFEDRFGLDRGIRRLGADQGLHLVDGDLESGRYLPFKSQAFEVITMLAVLEHIESERVEWMFEEVHRVLKDDGLLVLTTPAGWTGPLLRLLARLRLVSAVEIDEHETAYSRRDLRALLAASPFDRRSVRVGSFELGANNWASARR